MSERGYTVEDIDAIKSFLTSSYYDHELTPADYTFFMEKLDKLTPIPSDIEEFRRNLLRLADGLKTR